MEDGRYPFIFVGRNPLIRNSELLKPMKDILLWFLVFVFVTSCSPTYVINHSVTQEGSQRNPLPPSTGIDVYFEGEPFNFEYERVCLLDVYLSPEVNEANGLSHLKYLAWQNGADAVIAAKKDILTEVRGRKNYTYTRYKPAYHGIAVRRKINLPTGDSLRNFQPDTNYRTVVREDRLRAKQSEKQADVNSALGTVFFIVGFIAYIAMMSGLKGH